MANLVTNLLVLELCTPVAFSTVLIAALLNAKQEFSVTNDQASLLGEAHFFTPGGADLTDLNITFIPQPRISPTDNL
jgi:hypothetical protein